MAGMVIVLKGLNFPARDDDEPRSGHSEKKKIQVDS